ncbi:MAG TPA: hypothetical protein VIM55_18260 [Mucilaginibacter sp.]
MTIVSSKLSKYQARYMRVIKSLILSGILLIATTGFTFAQIDTTKVFNKQSSVVNTPYYKIKTSATAHGTEGKGMWVKGIRIRTARVLTMVVQTGEESEMEVFPGNELYITFANGVVDTIETRNYVRSKFGKIGYGSMLQVDYRVPGDEELDLLNQNVTKLTMQFNGGTLDFELDEKQSAKFKKFCKLLK